MPPGGEFHAVHGEGVGQPRHRSCGSPITALPWLESIRTPLRRRSATVSCRVSLQSAIRLSTSSNAMATDSVAALTSAMLTSGQRRDRTSRNAISGSTRGEQNRATKIENASRSLVTADMARVANPSARHWDLDTNVRPSVGEGRGVSPAEMRCSTDSLSRKMLCHSGCSRRGRSPSRYRCDDPPQRR
jgi:hypothetical protein